MLLKFKYNNQQNDTMRLHEVQKGLTSMKNTMKNTVLLVKYY